MTSVNFSIDGVAEFFATYFTPAQLLSYAERAYPALFLAGPATQVIESSGKRYTVRYYASTGNSEFLSLALRGAGLNAVAVFGNNQSLNLSLLQSTAP